MIDDESKRPVPRSPSDPWPSRLRRWRAILGGDRRARQSFWFRKLLRPRTPLVAVERHDLRILIETRDDTIGRRIYEDGDWQRDLLLEALEHIPERGRVFVDVGANIGPTTLYALRSGRFDRCVAIEPHPELLPLLRANLALNQLDSRVEVVAAAAAAAEGELELEGATRDPWTGALNMGDSRTLPEGQSPRPEHPSFRVRCLPLDGILQDLGIEAAEVGLVWMDIQGGEAAALAGSAGLLEAGVPFVSEFSPFHLKQAGGYREFLRLTEHFEQVRILGEDRVYKPSGLPVLADERAEDAVLDLLLLPHR